MTKCLLSQLDGNTKHHPLRSLFSNIKSLSSITEEDQNKFGVMVIHQQLSLEKTCSVNWLFNSIHHFGIAALPWNNVTHITTGNQYLHDLHQYTQKHHKYHLFFFSLFITIGLYITKVHFIIFLCVLLAFCFIIILATFFFCLSNYVVGFYCLFFITSVRVAACIVALVTCDNLLFFFFKSLEGVVKAIPSLLQKNVTFVSLLPPRLENIRKSLGKGTLFYRM